MLLSHISSACSCDRVGILKNQKASGIVFSGRVINIKEIITNDTITNSNKPVKYIRHEFTFKVSSVYKGRQVLNGSDTITIITTGGDSDCGNWFDNGKKYLVYAYRDNRKLHIRLMDQQTEEFWSTNLCTRTKKVRPFTFFEKLILKIT